MAVLVKCDVCGNVYNADDAMMLNVDVRTLKDAVKVGPSVGKYDVCEVCFSKFKEVVAHANEDSAEQAD